MAGHLHMCQFIRHSYVGITTFIDNFILCVIWHYSW